MTQRALVLLPPSQSKASGGRATSRRGAFDEVLGEERKAVRSALAHYLEGASLKDQERVLDARGELLSRAIRSLEGLGDEGDRLPAWRRYQGVVWSHLDLGTLAVSARRRVLIPSGAYGLLTAEDPIGDYRLKMNVAVPPLPVMARFWRPHLTELIETYDRRSVVVNLLPQEHAASIDFVALEARRRVIHVHFVAHDGERAVGHDAKAIKGVLARRALAYGIDALDGVTWNGWHAAREGDVVTVRAPAASERLG